MILYIVFEQKNKQTKNMSDWAELRRLNLFVDGSLISDDGEEFDIHRGLLATKSEFFFKAFSPPWNRDPVELDCASYLLRLLLDHVYNEICCLTDKTAKELLVIADKYLLWDLKQYCCNMLNALLSPSNCVGIQSLASALECSALEEAALSYTLANFELVVRDSSEWCFLPASQLESVLSNDLLNIRSEDLIEKVVAQWVESGSPEREKERQPLMATSRKLKSGPWLPEECTQREITWPRAPHQVIAVVGGYRSNHLDSVSGIFETYDPRAESWLNWGHQTRPRAYHGVAVLEDELFVVGGFDGVDFLATVEKYDPYYLVWTAVSPMKMPRCYVSVVSLEGEIYAMGGHTGAETRLQSCEKYNKKTDEWTMIAPMHCKRSDASAAVFNSKIYIAGGYDGTRILRFMEEFDPRTGLWTIYMNLPSACSGPQLLTANSRLWVLGGFDGSERLNTEHGTLDRTEFLGPDGWREGPRLEGARSGPAAEVLTKLRDPRLYSLERWTMDYRPDEPPQIEVGEDEEEEEEVHDFSF